VFLCKSESFLGNIIFIVEIIEFNTIVALTDLITWIFFICIVEINDFVELNAVCFQFLDVILSLWESKQYEASDKRAFSSDLISFKNDLINAKIFNNNCLLL